MDGYLLYTLPQYAIFAGITVIIYGWAEGKEVFERIGLVLFVLLGFFAVYILSSGVLIPDRYLTPGEAAIPEEFLTEEDISVEGKLIPVYWGLILSGLLALAAFLMKLLGRKKARLVMVIAGAVAIGMFFMILAAIKK